MSEPIERRRERRYKISAPLEYLCPERVLLGKGRVRHISTRGMYVEDAQHDLDLPVRPAIPLVVHARETLLVDQGERLRPEGVRPARPQTGGLRGRKQVAGFEQIALGIALAEHGASSAWGRGLGRLAPIIASPTSAIDGPGLMGFLRENQDCGER